jgi:hypothetical protein
VTDHLDDIASDLSAFHRIDDPGEMEAAVFFALAYRLPAYQGAMAAAVARQRQEQGGGTSSRRAPSQPRYEASSPRVTPRTADSAPPATAASLRALNTELGATWFTVRTVKAEAVTPDG